MASYTPLGSYLTVKSFSPGTAITIDMVSFVTSPTGIFCEYGVPHDAFIAEGSGAGDQPLIQALADGIEGVAAAVDCVTGGTFVQEVDPSSGLLQDFVQFFLSHTNPANGRGPFTTTVNVPVNDFFASADLAEFQNFLPPGTNASPSDTVGNACASLKALAGG